MSGQGHGREFWKGDVPIADAPGAVPAVHLRVNRSELGELSLEAGLHVQIPASEHETKGNMSVVRLAVGRSPSVAKPDNEAANRTLRDQPPFNKPVSLHPKPVCPMGPMESADLAIEDAPALPKNGPQGLA